jgi:hypothetical protein
MRRFLKALLRSGFWFRNIFPGFRLPKAAEDELKKELDADLYAEPQTPIADAEIGEKERQEAVRRYQRQLRERGQR